MILMLSLIYTLYHMVKTTAVTDEDALFSVNYRTSR